VSDVEEVRPVRGVVEPERRDAAELPSGRLVAWSEWGPLSGRPVIFCTGAGMGGSFGFGTDVLGALGLRLLAVDRPGLGRSTADPDRTLTSWSADIELLAASRGFQRPAAVGFSQGAPFALALAARQVVDAVAVVAGQDELAHPKVRDTLAPEVAALVDAVRADPEGVEREFAARATADGLWRLIVDMSSPADRARFETPAFARAYRRALDEGFAQGAHGYARDLVLAMSSWPFRCEEITVPVTLWYGREDTSPVHSPDLGATLAGRLPHAARTVLAGEGTALLWTRAADVLTDLRARSAR
jgi:pimeloyl-ACP methyl ester carboxylesterase